MEENKEINEGHKPRSSSRSHSYWSKIGQQQKIYRAEFGSNVDEHKNQKIWELMGTYQGVDKTTIQKSIVEHIELTFAKTRFDFKIFHCYQAVARSVRDRLVEQFNDTAQYFNHKDVKYIYYISLEFLIGRYLQNALVNIDLEDKYKEALLELGYNLESIYEQECDPALGNGGLGRLAACFLDSLATLNYPSWGYGIRYSYGIFQQFIKDGYQIEKPDFWLDRGNPWEIERIDLNFQIQFYGQVNKTWQNNKEISKWEGGEIVLARAYDNPIPGFHTWNCISLRLWKSLPYNEFDFQAFNQADYFKALEERERAEYITSVLYPNDSTEGGKELRLKQQYLLVSATVQDCIRRFMKKGARDWKEWPQKCSIQLNDTHPTLAIIELLRILIDLEHFEYDQAWELVYKSFAYTNHTVLPEALEKWSVPLLQNLLPRHMELIYLVNFFFMEKIAIKYPGDFGKMNRMSIIEESNVKKIRMANLCVVGTKAVNGVAVIHSELVKSDLFPDFFQMRPEKFKNKTNGVTPRRWIRCCNPGLAAFLTKHVQEENWLVDMNDLKQLSILLDDEQAQKEFYAIKKQNKEKLYWWVKEFCGIELNIESLFDVQVKRIHEYKRQFMNILYVIHRYLEILKTPPQERIKRWQPRSIMIGGKGAPGYVNAKRIIKLINCVGDVINNDQAIGDLLKVVFLPNYNVSLAQLIIPATELSQHISTAGTEASGTSNMKFVMNGSMIIGTLDGANVEICEEIGIENEFIFGAKIQQINDLRNQAIINKILIIFKIYQMKQQKAEQYMPPQLLEVLDYIVSGKFGDRDELTCLVDTIRYSNDNYLISADFLSYIEAQNKVDHLYKFEKTKWIKMSMQNCFFSGKFSSDRTIIEYSQDIWNIEQVAIPTPADQAQNRQKVHSQYKQSEDNIEKIY